ncbi:hypothetical protein [Caulobacter sp. NIBR2454]|uniref:hypothetical protein n=1 Tax=Caulobacter sp. NIBR2454 TaxID=3015996 RepID=UPI0022B7136A|nr:hypothetical protein [Caulobacter sp. NIBR2454]
MSDIRPNTWPAVKPQQHAPAKANPRNSAQKAFFDAALSKAGADAYAAPQKPQVQQQTAQASASGQPTRLLRPGSLINILV